MKIGFQGSILVFSYKLKLSFYLRITNTNQFTSNTPLRQVSSFICILHKRKLRGLPVASKGVSPGARNRTPVFLILSHLLGPLVHTSP